MHDLSGASRLSQAAYAGMNTRTTHVVWITWIKQGAQTNHPHGISRVGSVQLSYTTETFRDTYTQAVVGPQETNGKREIIVMKL